MPHSPQGTLVVCSFDTTVSQFYVWFQRCNIPSLNGFYVSNGEVSGDKAVFTHCKDPSLRLKFILSEEHPSTAYLGSSTPRSTRGGGLSTPRHGRFATTFMADMAGAALDFPFDESATTGTTSAKGATIVDSSKREMRQWNGRWVLMHGDQEVIFYSDVCDDEKDMLEGQSQNLYERSGDSRRRGRGRRSESLSSSMAATTKSALTLRIPTDSSAHPAFDSHARNNSLDSITDAEYDSSSNYDDESEDQGRSWFDDDAELPPCIGWHFNEECSSPLCDVSQIAEAQSRASMARMPSMSAADLGMSSLKLPSLMISHGASGGSGSISPSSSSAAGGKSVELTDASLDELWWTHPGLPAPCVGYIEMQDRPLVEFVGPMQAIHDRSESEVTDMITPTPSLSRASTIQHSQPRMTHAPVSRGFRDDEEVPIQILDLIIDKEQGESLGFGVYTDYEEGTIEILSVDWDGPSRRCGLRIGDVVTGIDGFEVTKEPVSKSKVQWEDGDDDESGDGGSTSGDGGSVREYSDTEDEMGYDSAVPPSAEIEVSLADGFGPGVDAALAYLRLASSENGQITLTVSRRMFEDLMVVASRAGVSDINGRYVFAMLDHCDCPVFKMDVIPPEPPASETLAMALFGDRGGSSSDSEKEDEDYGPEEDEPGDPEFFCISRVHFDAETHDSLWALTSSETGQDMYVALSPEMNLPPHGGWTPVKENGGVLPGPGLVYFNRKRKLVTDGTVASSVAASASSGAGPISARTLPGLSSTDPSSAGVADGSSSRRGGGAQAVAALKAAQIHVQMELTAALTQREMTVEAHKKEIIAQHKQRGILDELHDLREGYYQSWLSNHILEWEKECTDLLLNETRSKLLTQRKKLFKLSRNDEKNRDEIANLNRELIRVKSLSAKKTFKHNILKNESSEKQSSSLSLLMEENEQLKLEMNELKSLNMELKQDILMYREESKRWQDSHDSIFDAFTEQQRLFTTERNRMDEAEEWFKMKLNKVTEELSDLQVWHAFYKDKLEQVLGELETSKFEDECRGKGAKEISSVRERAQSRATRTAASLGLGVGMVVGIDHKALKSADELSKSIAEWSDSDEETTVDMTPQTRENMARVSAAAASMIPEGFGLFDRSDELLKSEKGKKDDSDSDSDDDGGDTGSVRGGMTTTTEEESSDENQSAKGDVDLANLNNPFMDVDETDVEDEPPTPTPVDRNGSESVGFATATSAQGFAGYMPLPEESKDDPDFMDEPLFGVAGAVGGPGESPPSSESVNRNYGATEDTPLIRGSQSSSKSARRFELQRSSFREVSFGVPTTVDISNDQLIRDEESDEGPQSGNTSVQIVNEGFSAPFLVGSVITASLVTFVVCRVLMPAGGAAAFVVSVSPQQ